jgi:hypothetical protein
MHSSLSVDGTTNYIMFDVRFSFITCCSKPQEQRNTYIQSMPTGIKFAKQLPITDFSPALTTFEQPEAESIK